MSSKLQKISEAWFIEHHTDNLTGKKIAEKIDANQSTVTQRQEKLSLDRNHSFLQLFLSEKIVRALFDNPPPSHEPDHTSISFKLKTQRGDGDVLSVQTLVPGTGAT